MKLHGSNKQKRLLYLGFAFPPGVQALHPGLNPAGHGLETQMIAELRRWFAIRSAGVLPFKQPVLPDPQTSPGISHELLLVDKPPEIFHRYRSFLRLKHQYLRWRAEGWEPEVVLVYNLSPIYNRFILWLRRQPRCPRLVLLLLDSAQLGQPCRPFKALRRRLKPMFISDSAMLDHFEACIGLSPWTERYFRPRGIPFLWMPGGCQPGRMPDISAPATEEDPNGRIRFGYYGALGPHAGARQLAQALLDADLPATLEICGYGKAAGEIRALAERDPRILFRGLLTPDQCLHFGTQCDVLVNPRPLSHGNQNNFASKLFEYALCGRAILTSRLSGAEAVLGPEADYFDARRFEPSLQGKLSELAFTARSELRRRGVAIRERVLERFSWEAQAALMAEFIESVCVGMSEPAGLAEAA